MSELMEALEQISREKGISKEVIIEAIEKSLLDACKKDFGKCENVTVNMDRNTGAIEVFAMKTVVEDVTDDATELSLQRALMISPKHNLGDTVQIEITPKNFGRIAAQQARSVIVQTIKEEEKKALFEHFYSKEKDVVTGVVQRYVGKHISVSLDDKMDALLTENEQIKSEHYKPTDRIKLYIVEVKDTNKGPRVVVSRTHPELVKRLFEKEVSEVADGTVEIKSIAREAGSRSKIAVWSKDPNVDAVGACVGLNGSRVNNIVEDLRGEKIDIITWNENPIIFIEHALSPSEVISVRINESEKSARVVVPDKKLSLAIGKEGQNARLAARLTGYKIDIKSESQARTAEEDLADGYTDKYEYPEERYSEDYDNQYDNEYNGSEGYRDDYGDGYDGNGDYGDGYDGNGDYRDGYGDDYNGNRNYQDGYSDDYDENGNYRDGYADDYDGDGNYRDGYADDYNGDGNYRDGYADDYDGDGYADDYDGDGNYRDGYADDYDRDGNYRDGYADDYDENGNYRDGYADDYDGDGNYQGGYSDDYDENGNYRDGYADDYDGDGNYRDGYADDYDRNGNYRNSYEDDYDEGQND